MIKRYIPNSLTCCNLISGCVATAFAFGSNPKTALLLIVIGAIFDFFDGMSARLMAAFSALRLAKFNLDTRQTTSFIGLPTPANALFWGALIVGEADLFEANHWGLPLLLILVCMSSWLMVSEIPMFALKFKHWGWKGNEVRYSFILLSVLLLILFYITAFALIIICYLLISLYVNQKQPTVDHAPQEH